MRKHLKTSLTHMGTQVLLAVQIIPLLSRLPLNPPAYDPGVE